MAASPQRTNTRQFSRVDVFFSTTSMKNFWNILNGTIIVEIRLFDRFQQLLETIFCIFDRDSSGSLSESEWIGSIYKIAEFVHWFVCSIGSIVMFCWFCFRFPGFQIELKTFIPSKTIFINSRTPPPCKSFSPETIFADSSKTHR